MITVRQTDYVGSIEMTVGNKRKQVDWDGVEDNENHDRDNACYKRQKSSGDSYLATSEEQLQRVQHCTQSLQCMKEKSIVEETRSKAELGDAEAMYTLGFWYAHGEKGLSSSDELAYKWFKDAADTDHVKAMVCAGEKLCYGEGVEENASIGMALIIEAAELGSNYACYVLGSTHYDLHHYFSPDEKSPAIYWLRKIFDGTCTVKHLNSRGIQEAKNWLGELEGE